MFLETLPGEALELDGRDTTTRSSARTGPLANPAELLTKCNTGTVVQCRPRYPGHSPSRGTASIRLRTADARSFQGRVAEDTEEYPLQRHAQFQTRPLPAAQFDRLLALLFGQGVK